MPSFLTVDPSSLDWIRPEIDSSLQKAAALVDQFEDHADQTALRKGLAHISEIKGNLRMVELNAAAQLMEEMEELLEKTLSNSVVSVNEVGAGLRSGIVGLSHYLSQLSEVGNATPLMLLSAINQVRGASALEPLPDISLFDPELNASPPQLNGGSAKALSEQRRSIVYKSLRDRYLSALLQVMQHTDDQSALNLMAEIINGLRRSARLPSVARLWWVAAAYIFCVGTKGDVQRAEKSMLARLDQSLKKMLEQGEEVLAHETQEELIRELLFAIATSNSRQPLAIEVREAFELDAWVGHTEGKQNDTADIAKRAEALETFTDVCADDIQVAQKYLAAYCAPEGADKAKLSQFTEILEKMATHAGDESLQPLQNVIWELRVTSQTLSNSADVDNQTAALQMASALLFIEDTERQKFVLGNEWEGQAGAIVNGLKRSRGEEPEEDDEIAFESSSSGGELPYITRAAANEIRSSLDNVEQKLEHFSENLTQTSFIDGADKRIRSIRGVFEMLHRDDAANLASETAQVFTDVFEGKSNANPALIDALAVSVGTLQEYVNGMETDRRGMAAMVERAHTDLQQAVRSLGDGSAIVLAGESAPGDDAVTGVGFGGQIEHWLKAPGDNLLAQDLREKINHTVAHAREHNNRIVARISNDIGGLLDAIAREPDSATDDVRDTLMVAARKVEHYMGEHLLDVATDTQQSDAAIDASVGGAMPAHADEADKRVAGLLVDVDEDDLDDTPAVADTADESTDATKPVDEGPIEIGAEITREESTEIETSIEEAAPSDIPLTPRDEELVEGDFVTSLDHDVARPATQIDDPENPLHASAESLAPAAEESFQGADLAADKIEEQLVETAVIDESVNEFAVSTTTGEHIGTREQESIQPTTADDDSSLPGSVLAGGLVAGALIATADTNDSEIQTDGSEIPAEESIDSEVGDDERLNQRLEQITFLRKQWWSQPDDRQALNSLLNSFTELTAEAQAQGMENVQNLAHCCENLLTPIRDRKIAASSDVHDFIGRAHRQLQQLAGNSDHDNDFELAAWMSYAESLIPENHVDEQTDILVETDAPSVDSISHHDELDKLFVEEGGEILAQMESSVQLWQRSADDGQAISDLQRQLHTLKGGAHAAARTDVAKISEKMELVTNTFNPASHTNHREELQQMLLDAHRELNALVNNDVSPDTNLLERCDTFLQKLGKPQGMDDVAKVSEIDAEPLIDRAVDVVSENRKIHALVVDDSATVRKVIDQDLVKCGMQVTTVHGGAEALQLLNDTLPDVMLVDVQMPEMDGYELVTAMRLRDDVRDLPVVMISGYEDPRHEEKALLTGAQAYLVKPYKVDALRATIVNLVGNELAIS